MYKQSPSRNHRSKGFKVKHVLQICLLLAVCFWLIYQVKRSHDKREEFDTKDEKSVGKVQTDPEILRFGRKDLPRITETATDVEHSLDEEEKEAEEEENKHEEDEPEMEDNRIQDKEDEDVGRGGGDGDDEIDENELAKAEAETEHEDEIDKSNTEVKKTEAEPAHEEEQVDEDKEREENEWRSVDNHTQNEEIDDVGNENHSEAEEHEDAAKQDHTEAEEDEDGSKADHKIEEHDHDGDSTNTHEAREEQYKADDASSEVTHDIQTIIPETGNVTNGHANEIWSKVNFGQMNETITSSKDDAGLQPREDEVNNNGTLTNATVTELKEPEINSTKSDDSSLKSSTLSQNATIEGATAIENPTLLGNISGHINKSELAVDDENQSLAAAGSNKTENFNTNARESLISSNTSASFHNTNDTNNMSTEGEKLENSGTDGSDESSTDHSSNESVNVLQHDPIDGSDTTLTQEEKDSRMDLDTLPEITAKVQNTDDTMAE